MDTPEYRTYGFTLAWERLAEIFTTPVFLFNLLLAIAVLAPFLICIVIRKKKITPHMALYAAFAVSVFILMNCSVLEGRPPLSVGPPEEDRLFWYLLWGVLLAAHWLVWTIALCRGKDPTAMILPMFLPWVLLCAVGLRQSNPPFAGVAALLGVFFLLKKRSEIV